MNAGGKVNLKNCTNGTVVGLSPSSNSLVATLNAKLIAMGYTT